MRTVKDADQRLCFVLASYNSGPAHVRDASNWRARSALIPRRWEHNVERTLHTCSPNPGTTREGM